ncbi:hypothetical protein YC2023_094272 [Brassica napus]
MTLTSRYNFGRENSLRSASLFRAGRDSNDEKYLVETVRKISTKLLKLFLNSPMTCTYLLACLLIRSHMLVTSYLLQLLVAFFMGRKSSAACAA